MIPFLPINQHYDLWKLSLPYWGTILFIGVLAAIFVYLFQAKKYNLPTKHAINGFLHFGFWGFIGIHYFSIFFVTHRYDLLFKTSGSNDSAGIILGVIALLIYLKCNKVPLNKFFDAITLPLMTVGTIVRFACMLIADEIGAKTTLPWAIYYRSALRHPIGMYYFIVSLLILGILFYLSKKNLKSGNLFLSTILLYAPTRILLDILRIHPFHIYFGLSVHQVTYSVFLILGIFFFILNNKENIQKKLKVKSIIKSKNKSKKK